MSVEAKSLPAPISAATVCEPCKKRKKSCNKALPTCSRCTRLSVKCFYTDNPTLPNQSLPPITSVVPEYLANPFWTPTSKNGLNSQITTQTLKLLSSISRKRGPIEDFIDIYFKTFHRSLPIINPSLFRTQLSDTNSLNNPHFSILLLGVFLATELRLDARWSEGGKEQEELYRAVKSFYSLLLAEGMSVELVQVGVILAGWEYCQALVREAWLTIGGCARMGYALGLHHTVRRNEVGDAECEGRGNVWWGIVVLERVISSEYSSNNLPFASQGPRLDDILPLTPREGIFHVSDDLVTPSIVSEGKSNFFDREFTKHGSFASTIQATYLYDLVEEHIRSSDAKDPDVRQRDTINLDVALQSFGITMIPPPGLAEGSYCGAFWMRTRAAYNLHTHSLISNSTSGEERTRATISLLSIARLIIEATRLVDVGKPLDLDTLSFWSHSITYLAAVALVRFGERNGEWETGLGVLKRYLGLFRGRIKLFENYLDRVEELEKVYQE